MKTALYSSRTPSAYGFSGRSGVTAGRPPAAITRRRATATTPPAVARQLARCIGERRADDERLPGEHRSVRHALGLERVGGGALRRADAVGRVRRVALAAGVVERLGGGEVG